MTQQNRGEGEAGGGGAVEGRTRGREGSSPQKEGGWFHIRHSEASRARKLAREREKTKIITWIVLDEINF